MGLTTKSGSSANATDPSLLPYLFSLKKENQQKQHQDLSSWTARLGDPPATTCPRLGLQMRTSTPGDHLVFMRVLGTTLRSSENTL